MATRAENLTGSSPSPSWEIPLLVLVVACSSSSSGTATSTSAAGGGGGTAAADGGADPCAVYTPFPVEKTPCGADGRAPGTCTAAVIPDCGNTSRPACAVSVHRKCADGKPGEEWIWVCACGGDSSSCSFEGSKLSGGCAP